MPRTAKCIEENAFVSKWMQLGSYTTHLFFLFLKRYLEPHVASSCNMKKVQRWTGGGLGGVTARMRITPVIFPNLYRHNNLIHIRSARLQKTNNRFNIPEPGAPTCHYSLYLHLCVCARLPSSLTAVSDCNTRELAVFKPHVLQACCSSFYMNKTCASAQPGFCYGAL